MTQNDTFLGTVPARNYIEHSLQLDLCNENVLLSLSTEKETYKEVYRTEALGTSRSHKASFFIVSCPLLCAF